jgi:hypothetical protein
MTPTVEHIMLLADEYAAASIETALSYTGDLMDFIDAEKSKKQALRAAIEQALKMEHLNYLGCMEDLKEAAKDEALLRQALELIGAWERGAESADYWFEIAALRERLK